MRVFFLDGNYSDSIRSCSETIFISFFFWLRIYILSVFKKLRQKYYPIQEILVLNISKWSENWQIHMPLVLTRAVRQQQTQCRVASHRRPGRRVVDQRDLRVPADDQAPLIS